MKKLLSTLFLFCLIVSAAHAGFTERSEPYLVKHFKSTAGKDLNVTTAGGHIQVIGTDARNASVALLVTDANGNYDKATIEKALKNYVITIREEKKTLARLEAFYKEYNPGFTLDYQFQDQEYAKQYASEQRVATLSGYFASIAILISCLGLFGLAAFTAERR